ncbi:MAG: hemolysin family protein [Fuerstiella sp.]
MSGVLLLATVTAAAALCWLNLMIFSLQTFSRSRLEEICKQHQKIDRFGAILQNYQKWLLFCMLAQVFALIGLTWTAVRWSWFDLFLFPVDPDWQHVVPWILRLIAAVVLAGLWLGLLPWTVARVRGEAVLYRVWPVLSILGRLAAPVWQFTLQLDRIVHRLFGVPEPDSEQVASLLTEELLTVVDESRREGVIQQNASTMIHRVVDLQTEDVAAIMTPRTDMVTIDADTPLNQAHHAMLENGFSRVPVIRDGIDDIVGILYARDLLAYATDFETSGREPRTVRDIAREVLYAPESQGIGDLLEAMRQQKVHMAIIVDEYSGVSGLVTLEDILEEIVGDINDEYDSEEDSLWKHHSDGCTEVDARYHLDDLNEEFGYGFPEDEEFDTIGGFALSCFGRIPSVGEVHRWKHLKLTVIDADERRLIRVRIEGDVNPPHVDSSQAVSA